MPFFIVGSERSGTTLLMAILGHHSRLAVPEVSWYYPRFRAYLHTYGDLSQRENLATLCSEMVHGLKTPYFGLPWNPATIVADLLAELNEPSYRAIFAAILGRYARDVGKPGWGEKTPHNLYYIAEILEDFPTARILHLNRDGRDVAVEQLRSAFGPTNIASAAAIWKRTQLAAEAARAICPPEQWLDVRYEELVAEPHATIQRVLSFLGESFEAEVLNFHRGAIAQRRARTRDHQQLGEPISQRSVGLFRRHLSLWEQEVFAGIAGVELERAGYASGVEPLQLSAEELALHEEWDQRVRAATLDAPEGHIVYESRNDWLAEQRQRRRERGLWTASADAPDFDWPAQFLSGQRAPLEWKRRFAIPRRYEAEQLVL